MSQDDKLQIRTQKSKRRRTGRERAADLRVAALDRPPSVSKRPNRVVPGWAGGAGRCVCDRLMTWWVLHRILSGLTTSPPLFATRNILESQLRKAERESTQEHRVCQRVGRFLRHRATSGAAAGLALCGADSASGCSVHADNKKAEHVAICKVSEPWSVQRTATRPKRSPAPSPVDQKRLGTQLAYGALMLDLIFIVVTIGFFALSIAYTRGCDRL